MNKSNLNFDPFYKQRCYCTCLGEMFEVNYLRRKYNHRLSSSPYAFHCSLNSPLRFLIAVQKFVSTKLFFKMQSVKNVLVYVFGVFTFSMFVTVFTRDLSQKLFYICVILLNTYLWLCFKEFLGTTQRQ